MRTVCKGSVQVENWSQFAPAACCTNSNQLHVYFLHVVGTKLCLCSTTLLQKWTCHTRKTLTTYHVPFDVSSTCSQVCASKLYTCIMKYNRRLFQIFILFPQICSSLISALMNSYLDDSASIDAISEKLRDLCPSLFSNDDAVSTKVKTSLQE